MNRAFVLFCLLGISLTAVAEDFSEEVAPQEFVVVEDVIGERPEDREFVEAEGAVEIQVGDEVIEKFWPWSVQRVIRISEDGMYQLEDGRWYRSRYIFALLETYKGISVGDEVIEKQFFWSTQRVVRISEDGGFQLEDGYWYHESVIYPLK